MDGLTLEQQLQALLRLTALLLQTVAIEQALRLASVAVS